jgi:hypothetical protein
MGSGGFLFSMKPNTFVVIKCYTDGRTERETFYPRGCEIDAMAFYVGIARQIDALELATRFAARELNADAMMQRDAAQPTGVTQDAIAG